VTPASCVPSPLRPPPSTTTLVAGRRASEEDIARCQDIFRACGAVEVLADEQLLHAATSIALPAFAYIALEALADAAVLEGLPRDIARRLAAAALRSAATMAIEDSDVHPASLRNDVESPGGVTIRATRELERGGYRAAIMNAVAAATARSIELGST
jgi:pyrroline-5-carboxylate reductase